MRTEASGMCKQRAVATGCITIQHRAFQVSVSRYVGTGCLCHWAFGSVIKLLSAARPRPLGVNSEHGEQQGHAMREADCTHTLIPSFHIHTQTFGACHQESCVLKWAVRHVTACQACSKFICITNYHVQWFTDAQQQQLFPVQTKGGFHTLPVFVRLTQNPDRCSPASKCTWSARLEDANQTHNGTVDL